MCSILKAVIQTAIVAAAALWAGRQADLDLDGNPDVSVTAASATANLAEGHGAAVLNRGARGCRLAGAPCAVRVRADWRKERGWDW